MNSLHRISTGRIIGGVCGGLADYLRIDPLIIRVLFVVLAMTTGLGLFAYIIMWVLVPVGETEGLSQEEIVRKNVEEISERARELGEEARKALGPHGRTSGWRSQGKRADLLLIGGFVAVVAGFWMLLGNLGLLRWLRLGKLWPLLVIALGVVLLLRNVRDWR
ncbi:MAG TPA: PspC domain-containing protein [Anaerolineae bacterium]|nr:PspC domain-containing protein [Anaerolineae bacterium]